jgi:fido (protein-threonine AMPylation protein)
LLAIARREVSTQPVELQFGLAGLCILLLHPFEDGNGRAARLVWYAGLRQRGFDDAKAGSAVSSMVGPMGAQLLPLVEAADAGDFAAFSNFWRHLVRAVDSD